jgi:hypothetical protein
MRSKANDHSKYRDWIDPADTVPYTLNAKQHTEKQIRNIANSIRRFGWQQDTVITADNVLVIGHGRREAALKLGCQMPYHRIDKTADELTDEDIRELRIADNQTNAETGFDYAVLEQEIDGLEFDGFEFDFGIPVHDAGAADDDGENKGSLAERYLVPPFSVLYANKPDWLARKRAWVNLGIHSELGRGGSCVSIPPMDGKGRTGMT